MLTRSLQRLCLLGICILSISGCSSMGPKRITPDRIDYIQEISDSWKKQMLLNIVKLRYFDPPTFLDVSSIINQYGIENQVNANAQWSWPLPTYGHEANIGGYSRYSDRPTITYTPLSGHKFTKNLLTPIPPTAVISLIQSGWPIDLVFSFAVKTINGVNNNSSFMGSASANDDFRKLITALRKVQLAGVSDIRVDTVNNKETIVFVISDMVNKEDFLEDTKAIRKILKIKPDANSYKIVLGSLAKSDDEIALLTRSMLEIMLDMAATAEVPLVHVAEKRVKETAPSMHNEWNTHIYSGSIKPKDAFAAVHYQDHWFWVDNKDISSKRNFALLMIFMSLTETDEKGNSPLFSIN